MGLRIAIDCPNATVLASFYGALLHIEPKDGGIVIHRDAHGCIEIWSQKVETFVPLTWPMQERGQQFHLDLDTEDRDAMIDRAVTLGATVLDQNPGGHFIVMTDPAGHPFCICGPH